MSQLTNFVREVSAFIAFVDSLATSYVRDIEDAAFLRTFKETEQYLLKAKSILVVEAEKLGQKLDQVDPVTGNKRYGDQSIQKLTQANEQFIRYLPILENIYKVMDSRKLNILNRLKEEETKAVKKEEPFVIVKYFEDSESLENPNPNFMKDVSLDQLEELHHKADEVRVRKMSEQEQLRRFALKAKDTIQDLFTMLEESAVKSSLPAQLILLQTNNSSSPQWKETKKMLNSIMSRIVSRPDDQNLRKLKAIHPVIQSNITGRHGGFQVLVALGFSIKFRDQTNDENENDLLDWLRKDYSSFEALVGNLVKLQLEDDWCPLLTLFEGSSPWQLSFEMEEPPIDDIGAGSQGGWIVWFDKLQADLAILEQLN